MTYRRLAALALALLCGSALRAADDPKLPDVKAFDKLVIDSLRGVHNKGADLYNDAKDFPAAYRLYQGALEAVRPLLAHRPEAQKLIETGLATAEKETEPARKAFVLHDTIEAVRKYLKTTVGTPKPVDPPVKKPPDVVKQPDPVKPVAPPPKEAKPKDVKPEPTAAVSGRVTFKGEPVAGGEVVFTLVGAKPPVEVKAKIADDGTYKFAEKLPAGKYAIGVSGKNVPAKYKAGETSGIVVELKSGSQTHDVELK